MNWTGIAVSIIPSIGLGVIFWFAMRAVIRADRNERNALARIEAEEDAAAAARMADAPVADAPASPSDVVATPDAPRSASQ